MTPRRRRRPAAALPLTLVGLVVVAACGGAVDNSELFKKNTGTTSSSGGTPTATATGTTSPPTAPTANPVPQPQPTPAAKCDVSFSTDVMQVFDQTSCAVAGCHDSNFIQPMMDPTSPSATYKALTSFKMSNGQPYVVVGSTNPKASGISCNLRNQCGTGMPLGDKLTSKELAVIDTWLACGAPLN